jgi:hypothetical protein
MSGRNAVKAENKGLGAARKRSEDTAFDFTRERAPVLTAGDRQGPHKKQTKRRRIRLNHLPSLPAFSTWLRARDRHRMAAEARPFRFLAGRLWEAPLAPCPAD